MVSRPDFLNQLTALFPAPRYLEIGVNRGETFFAVQAAQKIAVDPAFMFDVGQAQADHAESKFFEVTSDDYFALHLTPAQRFDVIYLDGLHTFEQTLRDFNNAIDVLDDRGIIVIDDVVPTSYQAALADLDLSFKVKAFLNDPDGSWMGDTFRLVFFIESFFPQFTLRTICDNHGQAVVWRGERWRRDFKHFSAKDISRLEFADIVKHEGVFHRRESPDIVQELTVRP